MEEQPHVTDTENTQQDAAQPTTDLSQPIAWQAPEGMQIHRTTGWYIAVGFVDIRNFATDYGGGTHIAAVATIGNG